MSVYDDEILYELKLNEVYSSQQLRDLISFSKGKNIIISEDTSVFVDNGPRKYQVVSIHDAYVHKANDNETVYRMPIVKNNVYIVKEVKHL